VAYAAIGGVIIVIVMAFVFFTSGGGGTSATPTAGTTTTSSGTPVPTTQSSTSGPAVTQTINYQAVNAITALPTAVPTATPATGFFIKVSYLGGFSGSYTVDGNATKVQDSGDRIFVIDGTPSAVSAFIQKTDSSTRHALSVEIWKDGTSVKTGQTFDAFGNVSVSYP